MIRDITLGQYYPVDSVLHRMDPRTKLFGTLVFIVSLFFANSIACYVAATLFLITAIRMSKVPLSFMGLKGNRISAADQCELQPVSDTGNAGGSVWHF